MASGPITSLQIDGETMETVTDFIFLDFKITADGDFSQKLKDACSLKKSCDKPRQSIKKQRHYVANKGPSSQTYGFSSSHVWMWELDNKVEHQRIDAFELWCWRRLLRVPWTARRSNPSILKVISPEYSLEGLMLKLKLQYFGHLMQRSDSSEKTLMQGKDWRQEKGTTEDEMVEWHHWLHECEQAPGIGDGQGSLQCCSPWGHKESDTLFQRVNWRRITTFQVLGWVFLVFISLSAFLNAQKCQADSPRWNIKEGNHRVTGLCPSRAGLGRGEWELQDAKPRKSSCVCACMTWRVGTSLNFAP